MKNPHKLICIGLHIVMAVIALPTVFAIEVDRPEIERVGNIDAIVFENYNGPYAVINTVAQIQEIGAGLARGIAGNLARESRAGNAARYQIIHAVDPSVAAGFDADILILGEGAGVDHIRNVRRIIAAYLSATYNYSTSDAETLAVFITVYNAVYRNDIDSFKQRYKPLVTSYLTREFVGLALSYTEWPGRTQIVIPISDIAGGLSSIETSVISDPKVIQSLKEENDKGIDNRKNMVDIKEREADTATAAAQQSQQKAAEAQQQLTTENERLREEEQLLAQKEKEAAAALAAADKAKQDAAANPKDTAAQARAEETAQLAADKDAEKTAQAEKTQTQAETATAAQNTRDNAQEAAATEQATADQKRDEAQQERKDIARDQTDLLNQTEAAGKAGAFGLKIVNKKELLSVLVKVSSVNGKEILESPINAIRGRTIYAVGNKFIAVAGKVGGNATVKLVLLDNEFMEIVGESAETLDENSMLVADGANFLVTIVDDKNIVLARYAPNLTLLQKSPVALLSGTPIISSPQGIVVTDAKGVVKLLKSTDLSEVK